MISVVTVNSLPQTALHVQWMQQELTTYHYARSVAKAALGQHSLNNA
jgi:hypothetical protein